MRFKFLPFLVVFFLQYGSAPSYGMELEEAFKDSKPFRRNESPIYLQWSKGISTSSEENASGFQVHSFKTRTKIGFVCTKLDKKREAVDFSPFFIEDTTLAPEVFRTLSGIFKASKNSNKLPPEIKYLCHTCSVDNKETIYAAKEAGFKRKIAIPNYLQITLEKKLPIQEIMLSEVSNGKQPLDSTMKSVNSIIVPKPMLENPLRLESNKISSEKLFPNQEVLIWHCCNRENLSSIRVKGLKSSNQLVKEGVLKKPLPSRICNGNDCIYFQYFPAIDDVYKTLHDVLEDAMDDDYVGINVNPYKTYVYNRQFRPLKDSAGYNKSKLLLSEYIETFSTCDALNKKRKKDEIVIRDPYTAKPFLVHCNDSRYCNALFNYPNEITIHSGIIPPTDLIIYTETRSGNKK